MCTYPILSQFNIYAACSRAPFMPASTHATLHATTRPLHGLPPPPDTTQAARDARQAQTLAGHSHLLYTRDVAEAYPTTAPGATYVHAAVNDGSMDAEATTPPPTYPRVQVHDPDDAHTLLRDHVQKPAFPYRTVLVGRGLIGQDDTDAWRRQRAWLKPAFKARHVHALLPLVVAEAEAFVAAMGAAVAVAPDRRVDVHEPLLATTFAMVGHLMLGERSAWLEAHGETLRAAFAQGLQPYFRDTPEGQRAAATMRAFAEAAFARHRDASAATPLSPPTPRRVTLLTRLLDPDPVSPYADDPALRHDELMTVLFAGHETTAHTLAWCLYELARHPAQQARVRAAIQAQAASLRRPPAQWTLREFYQVALVTQAVRETLRLWPVVANGPFRETTASARVRGKAVARTVDDTDHTPPDHQTCPLPAPTAFQVPHWTLHRHPALWKQPTSETLAPPDAFDLDRPTSKGGGWNARAYMPFSRPPRDCLGRHVATMEMQVLLTLVLAAFEVEWPAEQPAKRGHNWATLVPEDGVVLRWRGVDGEGGKGRSRL